MVRVRDRGDFPLSARWRRMPSAMNVSETGRTTPSKNIADQSRLVCKPRDAKKRWNVSSKEGFDETKGPAVGLLYRISCPW